MTANRHMQDKDKGKANKIMYVCMYVCSAHFNKDLLKKKRDANKDLLWKTSFKFCVTPKPSVSNARHAATLLVGPCHHGMARPQVADGGTASSMDGSCE